MGMFDELNKKQLNKEPEQPASGEQATGELDTAQKPVTNMFAQASEETPIPGGGDSSATATDTKETDPKSAVANTTDETDLSAPVSSLAALGSRPVSSVDNNATGIKPDFGPSTKTTGNNNVLKDVELPPNPAPDASPADITGYYLAKLNAVAGHITAGRSVLAELHTHLKENPDTQSLLLPENLGEITRVMGGLTKRAHGSAQAKKAKSQKKVAVKEEKVEKVNAEADAMGDIF